MQIHMAIRTCIRNLKVGRGVKNGSFRNMIGNNICGSSSKPPSLIDGEANLFKLGALDWGLKSVESSRER